MTITEIAGMLEKSINEVATSKIALEEATKKYEETIKNAEIEYGKVAAMYDSNLSKAQVLRNQLNTELNQLGVSTPSERIRGAA